jgi:hypothetical protein
MTRAQPSSHALAFANPVDAAALALEERVAELAAILAGGAVRLHARQSSSLCELPENSPVDFTAKQSGGVCVNTTETIA